MAGNYSGGSLMDIYSASKASDKLAETYLSQPHPSAYFPGKDENYQGTPVSLSAGQSVIYSTLGLMPRDSF